MEKKTLKCFFAFFIVLFAFLNCNTKVTKYKEFNAVFDELNNSSDTLRIPKGDSNYLVVYNYVKELNKQLNPNSLDTGKGSFQFRAWLKILGMMKDQHLIIINFANDSFSARLIRFRLGRLQRGREITILDSNSITGTPKSGWESFSEKLFSTEFLSIFDNNNGFIGEGGTDGEEFCFEIITKNHYWFSDYYEPFSNSQNTKFTQYLKKVVTLIEDEFEFHLPFPKNDANMQD